ncbi:NUDIX hydrolase [Kribbella sp. NPDC051587]|uniref:NUDIX hydrolase n=1 Tax=Kribbella sp. NPDC051587 TaxID=3364119 RepID=UPI0037AE93D7
MSFRLAAYGVCRVDGRVLLARYVAPGGEGSWWTLPGGQVEFAEDPVVAVVRELEEETGLRGVVEELLGVDSRVIPAHEARRGEVHQNVGVFYGVRVVGGVVRPEANGETAEAVWTPVEEIAKLPRSVVVDVGVGLATQRPASGHLPPMAIGGLVRH